MSVKLEVQSIDLESITRQAVFDHIAKKVELAFLEKIGPHVVDVAKTRAPVSSGATPHMGGTMGLAAAYRALGSTRPERNFKPKKPSFSKVELRPFRQFGERDRETRFRRAEVESILAENRGNARLDLLRSSDIQFFQGTGKNRGRTPDQLDIRKGGLVGAFRHRPGTLRDSIRMVGVRRSGNQVVLTVRASAPYARYVHQGFTHRGGQNHKGSSTRIKGKPFLKSALVNVRDRLKDPATYKG